MLTGGLALVLVLTGGGVSASADAEVGDAADPVADRGHVVVSGTVTRAGSPAVADILAVAWPEGAVLDKIPDEGAVRMVTLAAAKSATSGDYSISVDLDKVPVDYIDDSGQVDVDLLIADDTAEATWSFSLVREPAGWTTATSESGEGLDVSVDLESGQVKDSSIDVDSMVDSDFDPVDTGAAQEQTTTAVETRSAVFDQRLAAYKSAEFAPLEPICDTVRSATTHTARERWALSQGTTNVAVTAKQSRDLSHTLGVAIKGSSGWKMSGTLAKKTTVSGEDGPYRAVYYHTNTVRYRDYKNSCTGKITRSRPEAITDIFSGLTNVPRKNWTTCVTKSSGTYTKETEKNATISGAVKVHAELTAQAGWGTKASLAFKFTGPSRLCGSNGKSWVSAPQVVARTS
ncbi:hypothetical protein [Promicromonospora sukumoe]|uniref:hypothetical protein n=1 Tax=Promicromonospora sukumoe TaxID=88382 RepID=UPI000373D80F|nr:hypothetical protein [Promicromonospora sukumoe]